MLLYVPPDSHWLLRQENNRVTDWKVSADCFPDCFFPSGWMMRGGRKKKSVCIYGIFLDRKRQRQLGGPESSGYHGDQLQCQLLSEATLIRISATRWLHESHCRVPYLVWLPLPYRETTMCYIHCITRYKNQCILSCDEEVIRRKHAHSQMERCRFTGCVCLCKVHCRMNLGTAVSGNMIEVSAGANCDSCNNLNQWNKWFRLNDSPLISAGHKGWFTLMHSATDRALRPFPYWQRFCTRLVVRDHAVSLFRWCNR